MRSIALPSEVSFARMEKRRQDAVPFPARATTAKQNGRGALDLKQRANGPRFQTLPCWSASSSAEDSLPRWADGSAGDSLWRWAYGSAGFGAIPPW